MRCVSFAEGILKSVFLFLIFIYRSFLSPVLHFLMPEFLCKYPQSCAEYAKEEIEKSGASSRALTLISARLLSCGPWYQSKEKES